MADSKPKAVLERVPLSKLRPKEINPRSDFGDLDAFAAEFDDNPVFPGEPWTPPIVYRDANVYRIVDGERRYRAMKAAGKVKECNAYVFDTMEDAVAMLVMLDTNGKKHLSEGEWSAGLQQALMLGVPEEKVDARAGSKCAGALKRQIKRQGGKVSQLSIDQLVAADEFADDADAYDAIMGAGDGWRYKANQIRQARKDAEEAMAAEDAAYKAEHRHGLKVVDKPPKGAILERTLYGGAAEKIAESAADWAAEGYVLARPHTSRYGYMSNWEVYSMPPELTPEEEAIAKTKNQLRRQAQLGRKSRLEWVAERMRFTGADHGLPNTRRLVRDYILGNQMYDVEEFCRKADFDSDFFNDSNGYRIANEYVIAAHWMRLDHMTNADVDAVGDGTAKDSGTVRFAVKRHIEVLNALRRDGYEPSDEEEAFLSLCCKAAAGSGSEG